MVKELDAVGRVGEVAVFPVGYSAVLVEAAVVGGNALFLALFNPRLRAVEGLVGHESHRQFDYMGDEFGRVCGACEFDACGECGALRHLSEIVPDGYVGAEMEVVLQYVTVDIPHTMEVACGEPVGVEYTFGFGTSDGVEQQALELVVAEPILLSGADVIVAVPEVLGYVVSAYPFEQSAAILDGRPLQHAAYGYVEHDGVVVLEYGGIEDAGLAQADPSAYG